MKPREFWLNYDSEQQGNDPENKAGLTHVIEYSAYKECYELIEDLSQIVDTALHNGHHDLIARIKKIVKEREANEKQ